MVKEVRKITFSSEELLEAFQAYARTTPKFLPAGRIVTCDVQAEDAVKISMELDYGSAHQYAEFTYRGLDVLRPLILFCIENNIMLPRDGRKAYKSIDGTPVVIIELDLDLDATAMVRPMLNEHIRHIARIDKQDSATSCVVF